MEIAGYTVAFKGEEEFKGPNYAGDRGHFMVTRAGALVETLASEKRVFRPSGMQTTEVALRETLAGDLYIVMGDRHDGTGRNMRISFNPLITFIWLGALVMFLGGAISLTDRRYRIGAPKLATRLQAAE